MTAHVTLSDVARNTGLSCSTVSRALANHPRISEATRQRVIAAARDLRFAPNPYLTALVAQRKRQQIAPQGVIALLHCLPHGEALHPHMLQFRESARGQAAHLGYSIEEFHLHEPGMTPGRLVEIFKARGIHAIIIEHFWIDNAVLQMDLRDFAYVSIGTSMVSPKAHRIDHQHFQEATLALEMLWKSGYRRPLLATSARAERISSLRWSAAAEEFARAHERSLELVRVQAETKPEILQILENVTLRARPDSIISKHFDVLQLAQEVALRHSLSLGLVSLGWHRSRSEFAGVDQRWDLKGSVAVNQVVAKLERQELGPPAKQLSTCIACLWRTGRSIPRASGVMRKSTRPPREILITGSASPTLRSLAEHAGVSKMTVSRILRGAPGHDPATKAKVLLAAQTLGYQPNPLVSVHMARLRSRHGSFTKPTVAIVHCLPLGTPLTLNLISFREAAIRQAGRLGFAVIEENYFTRERTPPELLEKLKEQGVSGIIFGPFWSAPVKLDLDLSSFSVLAVGYSIKFPNLHRIDCDQHLSMRTAMRKLRSLGYHRICLANLTRVEESIEYRRQSAFLIEQLNHPVSCRIKPINCRTMDQLQRKLHSSLRQSRPDVVVTIHLELLQFLRKVGLEIPGDIGFAGLNLPEGRGDCAGIDCNWNQLGTIAASQAIEQINRNERGVPRDPHVTYIEGDWIEGPTLRGSLSNRIS